jgi:hypothetical protein
LEADARRNPASPAGTILATNCLIHAGKPAFREESFIASGFITSL